MVPTSALATVRPSWLSVEQEPQAQRVGRARDDGRVEPEEKRPERRDERAAQEVRRDCAHGVRLRRCPGVVAEVQPAAYTSAPGSPCRAPLSSDPPPRRPTRCPSRHRHGATRRWFRPRAFHRTTPPTPFQGRKSCCRTRSSRPVGSGSSPTMRLVQGDRQYFLSSSTDQSITVPWNCCWRIARASRST